MLIKMAIIHKYILAKFGDIQNMKVNDFFYLFIYLFNFVMLIKMAIIHKYVLAKFGDIQNMKVNDFFYLFIYLFIQLCDVDQNGNHT
jgi:hypothetical protein